MNYTARPNLFGKAILQLDGKDVEYKQGMKFSLIPPAPRILPTLSETPIPNNGARPESMTGPAQATTGTSVSPAPRAPKKG